MKNTCLGILILLCIACNQPTKELVDSGKQNMEIEPNDSIARVADKAKEWVLINYSLTEGCLENENCSPRYRAFLRAGIDAVIGNDASDEAYAALIKKWGHLYNTDEGQLDRGGFDPPFVKIISSSLKRKVQDTSYYKLHMQSMGYDLENPIPEEDFYDAEVKVIPHQNSFLIDEIIYAE